MQSLTISESLKKYQYINDKITTSHTDNLELKKIAILEKYGKKKLKYLLSLIFIL